MTKSAVAQRRQQKSVLNDIKGAVIKSVSVPPIYEHRAFLALFLLNTLVFVAECVRPGLMATYALKSQDWGTMTGLAEIVTSMFTHANFNHYFFNMLIVAPFAVYLERRIGSTRFLIFWLLAGIGAAVGFAYTPRLFDVWACVGASGACFGVIAAACWMVDEHPVLRALALFVLGALLWPNYIATVVGFVIPTGIASAAHLGGAVAGLVMANEIGKNDKRDKDDQ